MTGSEAMKERQKQAKALKENRKMTVIYFVIDLQQTTCLPCLISQTMMACMYVLHNTDVRQYRQFWLDKGSRFGWMPNVDQQIRYM